MKQVLLVVSILLIMTLQAQQTGHFIAEVAIAEVPQIKEQSKEKLNKFEQIKLELAVLKKENQRLKIALLKHRNCIKGNHDNLNEATELNVVKTERRHKKGKSNQNTLPPPL